MKFKILVALLAATLTFASTVVNASLILGTGTGALVGGDLTDPENDGARNADINYNATFNSNSEPGFGGGEFSFNVFDNVLTGGNGKWCCESVGTAAKNLNDANVSGLWVEANFGSTQYILDAFTLSSANDVAGRDADQWRILGSNDGVNYSSIFTYDNNGQSIWDKRFQVVEFSVAENDFFSPQAYSIFRYEAYSTVSANAHQLGELEFFGTQSLAAAAQVPEPSTLGIFALALIAFGARRFKK
ncbi:MAG: PEP-CTERM sorting domain-containing protein [Cognaticolwellia sp.]